MRKRILLSLFCGLVGLSAVVQADAPRYRVTKIVEGTQTSWGHYTAYALNNKGDGALAAGNFWPTDRSRGHGLPADRFALDGIGYLGHAALGSEFAQEPAPHPVGCVYCNQPGVGRLYHLVRFRHFASRFDHGSH